MLFFLTLLVYTAPQIMVFFAVIDHIENAPYFKTGFAILGVHHKGWPQICQGKVANICKGPQIVAVAISVFFT